jgi:hypothetical protein
MPGCQIGESRDGIPALCAEETKSFIRYFLGTGIQAGSNLLLWHEDVPLLVILQESLDTYKCFFEFVVGGAVGAAHVANATRAKRTARNNGNLFLEE